MRAALQENAFMCMCACTHDFRLEEGRNVLSHGGISVSQITSNGVKIFKNWYDA